MSDLKTWVVTGPGGRTAEVNAANRSEALQRAYDMWPEEAWEIMLKAGYTATEKPREVTVRAEDLEWATNALSAFAERHATDLWEYHRKHGGTDAYEYVNERIVRLKKALGK